MCSFGNSCGGIRFTKQKQMQPMNYIPKNCVAHGKWIVMPWRLVAVQLELISISPYRTCKRYEVEWNTIVQWGSRGIQWNAGRWNRFICWFHGDFVHICFLGWFHLHVFFKIHFSTNLIRGLFYRVCCLWYWSPTCHLHVTPPFMPQHVLDKNCVFPVSLFNQFFWRSCVHVNWLLWGTPVRNLLLGEIYCRGSFPSTKAHVAHFHLFFNVHGTTLSLRYLEPLFPTKFHANQLLIFSVFVLTPQPPQLICKHDGNLMEKIRPTLVSNHLVLHHPYACTHASRFFTKPFCAINF